MAHTFGESQQHLHSRPHHSFLQSLCLGIWLSSGMWLSQEHSGGGQDRAALVLLG